MRAMILSAPSLIDNAPLKRADIPIPEPGVGEILVRVETCGVCRTDLHVVEGELPVHREGIIPGHEIVGRVAKLGPGVERWKGGDRVGVAWLHSACGHCPYCLRGDENLCTAPRFTGYDVPGGYAEFTVARADFVYPIAEEMPAAEASIFLCAGIIGYRALVRSEIRPGQPIGLYGFGGSAHIVLQVARSWGCEVSVCTRGADHQALAREMGAVWVGDAAAIPPRPLRASILFAPAGDLVPVALSALDRGGTLALAGIYMTPIPEMDYGKLLFNEHSLRSVTANTRADGRALMKLAADIPLHAGTQEFALEDANIALLKLKRDELTSAAAVLRIGGSRPSAQDKDEVCRPADGIYRILGCGEMRCANRSARQVHQVKNHRATGGDGCKARKAHLLQVEQKRDSGERDRD